jgi:hypothetical protein
MGGPAMVEGGGLGVFKPEQIGPGRGAACQRRDRRAGGRRGASRGRRPALPGFFQGRTWRTGPRPTRWPLRDVVPENRLRVYDTRAAMAGLVDRLSLLELRTGFGVGHPHRARPHRRASRGPAGQQPAHLGGAIDADAADKAARFMQLCNAHGCRWSAWWTHRASWWGRTSKEAGPGAPCQPDVSSRRPICACPSSVWCCARATAWAPWPCAAGGFHSPTFTVAWPTGRIWRHGAGRRGTAGLPQGAGEAQGARRAGHARGAVPELVARQYEAGQA